MLPRPSVFLSALSLGVLLCGCRTRPNDSAPKPGADPSKRAEVAIAIRPAGSPTRTAEQILSLPDQAFDLGEAVLVFSKETNTSSNIDEALAKLDQLASAAKDELPLSPDAIDYIDALYSAILDRKAAEPFREDRPEDYDLAYTISKRRGTCLSEGILALAVARRIGAPLYGAQAPGHFLLRSQPGKDGKSINFDVTRPMPDKWRSLDDDFFRRWYKFDERTQASAGYLKLLSDKQVLAVYLASRSGYLAKRGDHEAALKDSQRALQLNPNSTTAALNAGYALESLSRWKEAEQQYKRVLQLDPQSVRAMANLAYLKVRSSGSEVYDPREAERIIGQALKIDPHRAYLHATLAEVKAARQDWRAAARTMQDAMALDKKNTAYRERFMEFRAHLRDEK